MTLQDITNKLFQYFINNNVFSLEENHSDIFEVSIDPGLERAALLKSLERFEEQKICSRLDIDGNPVFLLNQPLQSFYLVNPLDGITEFNVQVLLHIAETALAQTN